ncbi:hypothetical protein AN394_02234 [Pseudoalteromonas sp. P1-26]|nr:hypothetical protein AN213_00129 [Pseudoalteromonas sp. P1-8]KPZ71023.1 hypothetical protein AN394_02234 [Pseudoalteromonas sp. P1-26]
MWYFYSPLLANIAFILGSTLNINVTFYEI